MTSPKVTLTSAAGEVTLYLAFASPSFIPPRSPGPAVSLSLVPLRARHRARSRPALRRSPPRLGVSIRAHGLLEHLTTRDHTSIIGPVPFAIGGRIRRQGNDPPRLQRGQWLRSHNRWPPCRRGQGVAPIGSSPPRAPRARRAHLPVSVFDACSGGAALSPATAPRPRRCRAWHVAATLRPDSTSNHRGATALEAPSQPKAPGPAFLAP